VVLGLERDVVIDGGDAGRATVTHRVFRHLLERIVTLDLAPGSKISEAEIAASLGISRQPVRDAFFRLSEKGLLIVRPQRATVVAPISEPAVFEAQFLRLALESATLRRACSRLGVADLRALDDLLQAQRAALDADDRRRFHALDDTFHRTIAQRAGCGFVWSLIEEQKTQMDRIRFLTLGIRSDEAWHHHVALVAALRARDAAAAETVLQDHLYRILDIMDAIRAEHGEWFTPDRGERL
jgi:GntR family transcriptional regulator, rspAB operon transcriptional repressor